MSLVNPNADRMETFRLKTDSDRLKEISSRLRDMAHDETILSNRHADKATSDEPGEEIVLEYDQDEFRTDLQMLWVDGVGGYLFCLSDEVQLGQPLASPTSSLAAGENNVTKIGILADLSTRHVRIRRESGDYILLPHGVTHINEKLVEVPTLLSDGAEIRLGDSVKFQFQRPHALSSTALLRIVSEHRTAPATDTIVLMAESCVMGSKPHSHLVCPRWPSEVILFRGSEGILCRSGARMAHNGKPIEKSTVLRPNSRIEGQDFSFAVEGIVKS